MKKDELEQESIEDQLIDKKLYSDYYYFETHFEDLFYEYEEAKKKLERAHKLYGWEFEE